MSDRHSRAAKHDEQRPDGTHGHGAAASGSGTVSVTIDYDLCDDTGTCSMVCPEDVFEFKNGHSQVIDAAACTECWICVENCPSGAIEIR